MTPVGAASAERAGGGATGGFVATASNTIVLGSRLLGAPAAIAFRTLYRIARHA